MRAVVGLSLTIVGLLGGKADAYDIRGHDGGSCRVYFEEGGSCSEFLGGMRVFEYDGISLEAWDATLTQLVKDLRQQTQSIAVQDCLDAFNKLLCMSWFPPCDENDQPRRVCDEVCRYVSDDVCLSAFTIVKNVGQGDKIPDCDRLVGDPAGSESYAYWEYLNAWKDTDMFPSVAVEPTCADLTVSKESVCRKKRCIYPLKEYRIPKFANPADGLPVWKNESNLDYCRDSVDTAPNDFDCRNCESFCAFPCEPYPEVYSAREYQTLHRITYIPGFLSFPLNLLVFVVELKKLMVMKKWNFTDTFVLVSALLSLLLFFIEPLPSLVFGKEMRCNYEEIYTWEFDLEQEHGVCKLGKLRLHLLQALLFCVVGTLYKVFRQLKASLSMQKYTPGQPIRIFFVFLVLVFPTLLAIVTTALDSNQLYELSQSYRVSHGGPTDLRSLHTANRLRYAFTCGPRFSNEIIEMIVIHIPMLLAGVASVTLSALLLHIVFFKMGAGRTSSSASKYSRKQKNATLAKLAINMIRFAGVTTVLVAVNATATLMFVPQSVKFGFDLDEWSSCATTGIDYRKVRSEDGMLHGNISAHTKNDLNTLEDIFAHCGHFDEFKPSITLLILIAISNGLPPVAFGLVFALPALKQMRLMLQHKVSKIVPTTSAAASSSTDSSE